MKIYEIIISKGAKKDISEIYNYIAQNDLVGKARAFVKELYRKIQSLSILPQRGFCPHEIEKIFSARPQEIYCKSYRIIYEISGDTVIIRRVIDGRRNLEKLFLKKILTL